MSAAGHDEHDGHSGHGEGGHAHGIGPDADRRYPLAAFLAGHFDVKHSTRDPSVTDARP